MKLNKNTLNSCVILLLLILSNYIIYFNLSAITISIVFIISIIILVTLYNFSVDKLLNFFIFLFVLYPKKPISLEWTNKFLIEILVEANFVKNISFFEVFILPIFSIILFIKACKSYYKPNIEIYSGYLIVILFIQILLFSILFYEKMKEKYVFIFNWILFIVLFGKPLVFILFKAHTDKDFYTDFFFYSFGLLFCLLTPFLISHLPIGLRKGLFYKKTDLKY